NQLTVDVLGQLLQRPCDFRTTVLVTQQIVVQNVLLLHTQRQENQANRPSRPILAGGTADDRRQCVLVRGLHQERSKNGRPAKRELDQAGGHQTFGLSGAKERVLCAAVGAHQHVSQIGAVGGVSSHVEVD